MKAVAHQMHGRASFFGAGAVLVAATVMACSSGGDPTSGTTPASSTFDPAVARWGAEMSPVVQSSFGSVEEFDDRRFDTVFQQDEPTLARCEMSMVAAARSAEAVRASIEQAQEPGGPSFISAVPDELAGLVEDTNSFASRFEAEAEKVKVCTDVSPQIITGYLRTLQMWGSYSPSPGPSFTPSPTPTTTASPSEAL